MRNKIAQITRFKSSLYLSFQNSIRFLKSRKTHNYTQSIPGKDYVFEWIDPISGRITGQGRGVRQRDYLVLKHDNTPICYQVEAIDYYADPADMWCALLKQVEEEP